MRLLLDTHIALWAVTDDLQLSEAARAQIVEPANEVFISVATIWEIAIKHAVRRRVSAMPVSAQAALNLFRPMSSPWKHCQDYVATHSTGLWWPRH